MAREYYSDSIRSFLSTSPAEILGKLTVASPFSVDPSQRDAWLEQIHILKKILSTHQGSIYFEYSIPRMGRRIDVLLLIGPVIFVLEFKVGEREFHSYAIDQVWDYALDLKNFHDTSRDPIIAPILVSTNAPATLPVIAQTPKDDNVLIPIKTNADLLGEVLKNVILFSGGENIDADQWAKGRYSPTPTIIEAARALYAGHTVEEISRHDAGATNLKRTSAVISEIIASSKK